MKSSLTDSQVKNALKTLQSKNLEQKISLIHQLGKLDTQKAIPVFLAALKDKNGTIRALAMGKLVFINNKRIIPEIRKYLTDPNPQVRQHAIYALQRLKDKTISNKLASLLTKDKDPVVRLNAVTALEQLGSRKELPALVKALNDKSFHVVVGAVKAIARIAPSEVAKHIIKLVNDKKRWSRIPDNQRDVILKFLQKDLKNKEVLKTLRRLIEDNLSQIDKRVPLEVAEAASLLAMAGDTASAVSYTHLTLPTN